MDMDMEVEYCEDGSDPEVFPPDCESDEHLDSDRQQLKLQKGRRPKSLQLRGLARLRQLVWTPITHMGWPTLVKNIIWYCQRLLKMLILKLLKWRYHDTYTMAYSSTVWCPQYYNYMPDLALWTVPFLGRVHGEECGTRNNLIVMYTLCGHD